MPDHLYACHNLTYVCICRRTVGLQQLSHCHARWKQCFSSMLDGCRQSTNMVCTSQQSACCRFRDAENWGLLYNWCVVHMSLVLDPLPICCILFSWRINAYILHFFSCTFTSWASFQLCLFVILRFRSTLLSRPNKVGLKCLSIRPFVHPQNVSSISMKFGM